MLKDFLIFIELYVIFRKAKNSAEILFEIEDSSKEIVFLIIHPFLMKPLLDLNPKKFFDLQSHYDDDFTLV